MKTRYILPALLALSATVISTQAMANGMTYDPYQDYYSKYYGIGEVSTGELKPTEETQTEKSFYDPYANYYNTYYGVDGLIDTNKKSKAAVVEIKVEAETENTNNADMADPTNYYNW